MKRILRKVFACAADQNQATNRERTVQFFTSRAGRNAIDYLTHNFDGIHWLSRGGLVLLVARTGLPEAVPLIVRALQDPLYGEQALPGIFSSCCLDDAPPEYCRGVAPAVAAWLDVGSTKQERAIGLLPCLDPEFACATLINDRFLSPSAVHAPVVLGAFNACRLTLPLSRIKPLLRSWRRRGLQADSPFHFRRGYREAVCALAAHDPQRALSLTDEIVAIQPDEKVQWSAVVLAAAGLTGLSLGIGRSFRDLAEFARLPLPAQYFFAVEYFHCDEMNGGISQALWNSTGDFHPWVNRGLKAMGASRELARFRWMCRPFGKKGPSPDRMERCRQMESMVPRYFEQENGLYESCPIQYTRGIDEPVEWILSRYAAKNAKILRRFVLNEAAAKPTHL